MKNLVPLVQLCINLFFLLFISQSLLQAQICTGSLGDAVVNVTFGSGANPGNSLPSASTNYFFTSSSCPNDGSYTVVNSTSGCFGNSWHTIPEDHTPNDVNGYMMLVNASVTPGDFYLDTVKNLCANTKYEFGAWITNVLLPSACNGNGTRPQLTFKIETETGTLLSSYNTGDIFATSSPEWKQYGFFFSTPVNSSTVVIRITNNAPGGCGNDLALDDITFRPCGPTVTAGFGTANLPSLDLCNGDTSTKTLSATVSSGYTSPSYQWQINNGNTWTDIAGATSLTYVRSASIGTGIYKYRLTVAEGTNISISNCRVASNEAVITIHNPPVGTANSNSPVCENSTLVLSATGGTAYQWNGPAGFSSAVASPSFTATNTSAGQYAVFVSDAFGCMDTATTVVNTFSPPVVSVSNAQNICAGDSVVLQAGGGNSYLWSPLAGLSDATSGSPIAKPATSTTYTVTVTGNNNCTGTAAVLITVNTKPIVNAGANKSIIKGQSIILDGSVNDSANVNFIWAPSLFLNDASLLAPIATPTITTTYILMATSTIGCGTATDTVLVKVFNDLYIPNAFSPNGDNRNETWRIDALAAYPNAIIIVYNRYGQKVFESSSSNKEWDGKFKNTDLPAGAYPYIINLKNNRPVIKGMVIIVR